MIKMNTERFDFDKWLKENAIHYTGSIEYNPYDAVMDWADTLGLVFHGDPTVIHTCLHSGSVETEGADYQMRYEAGQVTMYKHVWLNNEDMIIWQASLSKFMDRFSNFTLTELIENLQDIYDNQRAAKLQDTISYIISDFLRSEQFIRELRESDVITEGKEDWGNLLEYIDEVVGCGIESIVNDTFTEAYSDVIRRALTNKL